MGDVIGFLLPMFLGLGMALGIKWLLGRWTARRVGTEVGPVPAPYDLLVQGDVLLWFHSPTCAPCRAMRKDVDALTEVGRVHPIDVTRNMEMVRALSVLSTPTTVRVTAGRVVDVKAGYLRRDALEAMAG